MLMSLAGPLLNVTAAGIDVDSQQKAGALKVVEEVLAKSDYKVQFRLLKAIKLNGTGGTTRSEETILAIANARKRVWYRPVDLGAHLVHLGLATPGPFDHSLSAHARYGKYYRDLIKTEERARKKKVGMWGEETPQPRSTLRRLIDRFSRKKKEN